MPSPLRATDLVSVLDELFWGPAWHGPSLRGALRGVTPAIATRRPQAGRHNIAEIAIHAAYWKYAVRRRLTGEKRGSFAADGSNWFRRDHVTTATWRAGIARLVDEHRKLCSAVRGLGPKDLARRVPRSRSTFSDIARGVAAHDAYHAGQIQLIKRMVASGRRSR
jgi:hypothetical protein